MTVFHWMDSFDYLGYLLVLLFLVHSFIIVNCVPIAENPRELRKISNVAKVKRAIFHDFL